MVSGIQVIGAVFGLALSYFTFLHFKRREFTLREFVGWQALWAFFMLVPLFPRAFAIFAGSLGALRPLDLFSVLGFIVVLSISFYTYVNVDRLRRSLEKTIRDLALKDLDRPHK